MPVPHLSRSLRTGLGVARIAPKALVQNSLRHFGLAIVRSQTQEMFREMLGNIENQFIEQSELVLHVGAHTAEERHRYSALGKKVIWVEAVPEYAKQLQRTLLSYEDQEVVCALAGSMEGRHRLLNVAGSLSSTLPLSKQSIREGLFIDVEYRVAVSERRLDLLLSSRVRESVLHMVIDVQGAELEALNGASDLLKKVNSLRIEVSTSDRYEGGTQYPELVNYLSEFSLRPLFTPPPNEHLDVLFYRTATGSSD